MHELCALGRDAMFTLTRLHCLKVYIHRDTDQIRRNCDKWVIMDVVKCDPFISYFPFCFGKGNNRVQLIVYIRETPRFVKFVSPTEW